MIETRAKSPIGFFTHPDTLAGSAMMLFFFELGQDISWQEVTPAVLRYLQHAGEQYAEIQQKPFDSLSFFLGGEHPLYEVLSGRLTKERTPSSWYVRIADLVGFIRNLASVLENRLARSTWSGYSGVLQISFYTDGIALKFEDGKLDAVSSWQPQEVADGHVSFPGLTFTQLLLGYRSLQELQYSFIDCQADEEISGLLNVLFPKEPSSIWSLE